MSTILKFDFRKREQLRFSEANYLNYTKNTHVATTFSLKQGEPRTSHGPIPHPLMSGIYISNKTERYKKKKYKKNSNSLAATFPSAASYSLGYILVDLLVSVNLTNRLH